MLVPVWGIQLRLCADLKGDGQGCAACMQVPDLKWCVTALSCLKGVSCLGHATAACEMQRLPPFDVLQLLTRR